MIDKKPWNCSVCEESFAKFSQLTNHREDHHQFEESAIDNGSKQNSKNANAQGSKYKCKVCQIMFPDKSLLMTHSCVGRPAPKIYKCKTCPKEFLYMCKLVQHEKIHVMDKPYKCVVCYCSFSHPCHLGRHMMTHSASANNKCIVCSKVFKNSALLQKHKLIHNSERVFKCDLCPQTFTDLSRLTTHLNGHVNDQKVNFEESTKSGRLDTLATKSTAGPRSKGKKRTAGSDRKWNFRSCRARNATVDSRRWGKRRNILKTAQENLEVSSDCQKIEKSVAEFGSEAKSSLKAFVFHCDICNKAFSRKEEFETHLELHTMKERQQYVCEICQQCFISSSLHELHVKNCHQKKKILPNGQCMPRLSLFEKFESVSPPEASMFTKVSPPEASMFTKVSPLEASMFTKVSPLEASMFTKVSPLEASMFTKVSPQSGTSHLNSTTKQAIFLVNSEKSLTFTNPVEDSGTTDVPARAKMFLDCNFRCLICNKHFVNSFALDLHLETHIIVKTLPRNRHTTWSIHFPQKKFCCKICRKTFSQRMILRGHSRIMHHASWSEQNAHSVLKQSPDFQ